MDPRGAQGGSGPHFIHIFAIFEALWEARQRQKEPQGAQRRPKWSPKWSRRHAKAISKGYFFKISKTLNLNDSTVIFMVFLCPGGSLGVQKTRKWMYIGLHMAAKVLQMHHADVHGVYGRWLPGHQDPRIQVMRSRGGKLSLLGATPPSRLMETASKIQETSMQHTACRHRCRMQGCKGCK